MANLAEATALHNSLKTELLAANPDLKKCDQSIAKLKIQLAQLSFLSPGVAPDPKVLILARDVLEMGAQYAIRVKDIPAFDRYMTQLLTYYHDYSGQLPESQRMYPLIGLNLLRLLAENRISDFHTALETIQPSLLHENIYIRHPVQLEQSLMEGSYNKVWNARQDVPAKEYLFFIDILMETIRNEIASCSEKAYASLPLADAATILFFKDLEEILTFAKNRGWTVIPTEKRIYFRKTDTESSALPAEEIIQRTLVYARELEQIV